MEKGNSSEVCLSKFFKVYLAGESGDDLVLPISFNSCLPKSLPKNVTVRSIYGKNWKLALKKTDGEYVLVDGWKRIAKDEHLNGGDFLALEFDGSRCFNFCIYERRTSCKRLGRSSVQTDEIKEESDGEEDDDVIVLDDDDDDDDSEDAEYDDADDDVAIEDTDDDDQKQYVDDRKNPSFTVTLNPKKLSQLLIPAHVIKDYGLTFPEHISIVDPLANEYGRLERKIKIQKNGSVFVKGFGSIIRRNLVKTSGKMICELKKNGSNNLVHTMKVYVVSA